MRYLNRAYFMGRILRLRFWLDSRERQHAEVVLALEERSAGTPPHQQPIQFVGPLATFLRQLRAGDAIAVECRVVSDPDWWDSLIVVWHTRMEGDRLIWFSAGPDGNVRRALIEEVSDARGD